ncbi:hypothetical protein CVT25_000777 [Psilocybe cyanescens]|uniref:Uncharacterized protein n=1 Tax=Psilocybe cyanescens TaxID=93625 RepID=A0A409XAX1_PSICY|nr:hypothetical protein CVT25_000777 [Psilocybe cyanescens]
MSHVVLTSFLQDAKLQRQLKKEKEEIFDPPPYSSSLPPYSASPSRSPSRELRLDLTLTLTLPTFTRSRWNQSPCASLRLLRLSSLLLLPHVPRPRQILAPTAPAVPPARRVLGPNVVVYIYRMVMYGVEKRYRAEIARTAASATSSAAACGLNSQIPMSGPCASVVVVANVPSTVTIASDVKFAVDLESASLDDDDSATAKDDSDHIFPSFDSMLSSAKRRQRIAELEMQAALLAIRFFEGSRGGCAEDEEQTREQEEDEDSQLMKEAECEMHNIALGQREPLPSLLLPLTMHRPQPAPSGPPLPQNCVYLQVRTPAPRRPVHVVHECVPTHEAPHDARVQEVWRRRVAWLEWEKRIRERVAWAAEEEEEGCVQEMEEEYDPSSIVD